MSVPFKRANILLPKKCDMEKWAVIACDQYTSNPKYWDDVKRIVGDSPSTLNLTIPEIYLNDDNVDEIINSVNANMNKLVEEDFFEEYKDSMFYVERTQSDGKIREGIIGMIDLEAYNFEKGSTSLVRATEKTITDRIPPRVRIRKNAPLEFPHIMILIDDEKREIIENLKNEVKEDDVVYDFDLMKNGGHIKGYLMSDASCNRVEEQLEKLGDKEYFNKKYGVEDLPVLLFAMGDGNHSLATAKTVYENLKETMSEEEYLNNPARYALVEIVNLHSDALKFEAIHRVLFNVDVDNLFDELDKYYDVSFEECEGQRIDFVSKNRSGSFWIKNPKSNISLGSLQLFLDEYLEKHKETRIDYVHGEEETTKLGMEEGNMGFILEAMGKDELFKTVMLDGALPRKTFSMGHSDDKRFYLEARKIK